MTTSFTQLFRAFGGTVIVDTPPIASDNGNSEVLGNAKDAAIAQSIYDSIYTNAYEETAYNIPTGWEFLGRGSFRGAFLSPEGIVYKVMYCADYEEHDYDRNESHMVNSNDFEIANYAILAPLLPERIRCARVYKWTDTVIAQEKANTDYCDDNRPADIRELLNVFDVIQRQALQYPLRDIVPGNYGWKDNALVVFDYSV